MANENKKTLIKCYMITRICKIKIITDGPKYKKYGGNKMYFATDWL